MDTPIIVRIVRDDEMDLAYNIMKQLRPAHSLESFKSQVFSQLRSGYQLFGAFEEKKLLGLLGCRPVLTLARGCFLHVDDLVVDEVARKTYVGKALMEHIHQYAQKNAISFVSLDARPEAIGFYEKIGYTYHPSPSMKIVLDQADG